MKNIFISSILACGVFLTLNSNAAQSREAEVQMKRSERIRKVFNELRATNLFILDEFYHPDAKFQDPLHKLDGLSAIKNYYAGLYKNVEEISFEFTNEVVQGDTHVGVWVMNLKAPGLNGGKPFKLDGNSVIKFDPNSDKVIYHRDYFDMGEFIYEQIPVLKNIIQYIKSKLKGT